MAKPTFLQSLLNKPTQSYAFPAPPKEYHSQKKEFIRVAKEARPSQEGANSKAGQSVDAARSSITVNEGARSSIQGERKPDMQNNQPVDVIHGARVNQIHEKRRPLPYHGVPEDSSSSSDSEEDIFYTPNPSPRSSLIAQTPHTETSLLPFPARPTRLIREDSVDSMTSTTATTAADVDNFDSVSVDDSIFSLAHSDSTRVTTPVTSDAGHYPKQRPRSKVPTGAKNDVTYASIGSSSQLPVPPNGQPLRRSATNVNRSRRPTPVHADSTPVDYDNWAKEVRWLVPPSVSSSSAKPKSATSKRRAMPDTSKPSPASKPLRSRRSKSLIENTPRWSEYETSHSQAQMQSPPVPQPYAQRRSKSASPRKSKTVTSMTALVEVEEPSEANELHHALMGRDRTRTHSLLRTPSKLHLKPQSSRSRVSSSPSTPPQLPEPHPPPPRSQYTTSSRTVTLPNPLPITSASTSTNGQNLPSSGTPGYTSLVLPRAAYPIPAKSKASSRLGFGFGVLGGGEVDLTKGGMAQTTMASVEVVQGIAEASSSGLASNSATKAARRKTLSKSFTMPTFLRGSGFVKGKEKAVDESPLAFTSWRKPPGYVGANGVLVQIWAVAVDAIDQVLVNGAAPPPPCSGLTSPSTPSLSPGKKKKDGESTKKAEVGFIPGRSFVGRVLEAGWEIGEEVIKKNDWVVGLLDVKKCGAMAEFVVVDRRRLHRVPYPRMRSNSASPDMSIHSQALTLEELALLPLAGVPAHRAVRTFASVEAEAEAAPRALVLRGHDGVGAMAVQMLARRGWRVCVHVPVPTRLATIPGVSRSYIDEDSRRTKYLQQTEEVIRSWGAEEVLFVRQHDDDAEGRDGAIKIMERLMEADERFDGVLDMIGGKEVWDAGEALLASGSDGRESQFTTLVGDSPDRIVPSTSDLFKTGVRATKKHGTSSSVVNRRYSTDSGSTEGRKKTKAKVGYAWVIINQDVDWQGEDIADSLRAVIRGAAVDDGVRPLVTGDKIVPFEKAPDLFIGGLLESGGTVVVNVVS